jgi:recombinational DNA repair protein (RecF pathway)
MKTKTNQPGLPKCVSCENPVVLVAFCPQCNGMVCVDCVNAHKNIKKLRWLMFNEFKHLIQN